MEKKVLCVMFYPEDSYTEESLAELFTVMKEGRFYGPGQIYDILSRVSEDAEEDIFRMWERREFVMCVRSVSVEDANQLKLPMDNQTNQQAEEGVFELPPYIPVRILRYLPPREQYIVSSRRAKGKKRKTYKEIAAHFEVGTRFIKKVEAQALRKLVNIYKNLPLS